MNYYIFDLSPQWNKAERNCKVHKDVLIKPNLTNLYQSTAEREKDVGNLDVVASWAIIVVFVPLLF